MKKMITLLVLMILPLLAHSAYAGCVVPPGEYQYLFSDGYQTYYFNTKTTLRVDRTGLIVVENGDFDYDLQVGRYQRQGDQFSFTNSNGLYTGSGKGPIYFTTSNPILSQVIDVLPVGSSTKYPEGAYTKQMNGKVLFKPAKVLPPITVNEANCDNTNVQALVDETDDIRQRLSGRSGHRHRNVKGNDENVVVQTPMGTVDVNSGEGKTIIRKPDGTVIMDAGNGKTVVQKSDGTVIMDSGDGKTIVRTPGANVDVDAEEGRTTVQAPGVAVDVEQ